MFNLEFSWRDAANWDNADTMQLVLFVTDDNLIAGTATDLIVLNSGTGTGGGSWETETATGVAPSSPSVGKRLFVRYETASNVTQGEFSRNDNIFVEVVPEPASAALLLAGGTLMLRRRR